jgi:hypothetical protein
MSLFPPARVGLKDEADIYGTFTEDVAQQKGIVPFAKRGEPRDSSEDAVGEETSIPGKQDEDIKQVSQKGP